MAKGKQSVPANPPGVSPLGEQSSVSPKDARAAPWRGIVGLLFALCCISAVPAYATLLLVNKGYALNITPDVLPSMQRVTWSHVIPAHPHNMTEAWALGRISEALLHCVPDNATCISVLLQEAATVIGRSTPLTLAQLRDAKMYMEDVENHRGVISRMYGAMNLVNTMWLIGATGILIFIVPATLACFHQCGLWSLLATLLQVAATVFTRVFVWLYVHTFFMWCPLVYCMIAVCLAHSVRSYDANPTIASYMGASALVVHAMTIAAHFQLYPGRTLFVVLHDTVTMLRRIYCPKRSPLERRAIQRCAAGVVLAYFSVLSCILAIALQSRLMGFFTIVTIFANLGFLVIPYGLGWVIGFEDDSGLLRCKLGSLAVCSVFLLIRTSNDSGVCYLPSDMNPCFPLLTATQSFGAVVFFLAQLISSSSLWNRTNSGGYWSQQIVFLAAVSGSFVGGLIWDVSSLVATSCTFLVLYAVEKLGESDLWNKNTILIGSAAGSFCLWRLASFLSHRPDIAGFLVRLVCAVWNDEDLQNAEIQTMLASFPKVIANSNSEL